MTTPSRSELTGVYVLDQAHTQLAFVARHAMVTKVRGTFREFAGAARIDAADPGNSSAQVTIKTASIDTGNEQRDSHLRTNDFLDAPAFPDITFVSTAVTPVGADRFDVTGDLTVKATTRSLTIPFEFQGSVVDPHGNVRLGFEGHAEIHRKDFGVNWNVALESGGILVSDRIRLEIDVSAIKQS